MTPRSIDPDRNGDLRRDLTRTQRLHSRNDHAESIHLTGDDKRSVHFFEERE